MAQENDAAPRAVDGREEDKVRQLSVGQQETEAVGNTVGTSRRLNHCKGNRAFQAIEEELLSIADRIHQGLLCHGSHGDGGGCGGGSGSNALEGDSLSVPDSPITRLHVLQYLWAEFLRRNRCREDKRESNRSVPSMLGERQERPNPLAEGIQIANGEFDEDDLFFLRVAQMIKKISPVDKCLVKMKLCAFIIKARRMEGEKSKI